MLSLNCLTTAPVISVVSLAVHADHHSHPDYQTIHLVELHLKVELRVAVYLQTVLPEWVVARLTVAHFHHPAGHELSDHSHPIAKYRFAVGEIQNGLLVIQGYRVCLPVAVLIFGHHCTELPETHTARNHTGSDY